MITYADPRLCPSCRTALPAPTAPDHRCATCGVPVGHALAVEVFGALQRVDTLVGRLRAVPAPVAVPAPRPVAPAPTPAATPTAAPAPQAPWVPTVPVPRRTGVRGSSIPVILLTLGAGCLLVAAVIFLAVAWGWLGLGGRTAVLLGGTLAAAATARTFEARNLRVAAEALSAVALGVLVLDVLGAVRAGWLDLDGAGLGVAIGVVLAAGGAALAMGPKRLVVPQLTAVAGLFAAQAALPSVIGHELLVAGVAALGLVVLASKTRPVDGLAATTWVATAGAVLAWGDLTLTALVGLGDLDGLTVGDLWTSASGIALLASALLVLAPQLLSRDEVLVQLTSLTSASAVTGLVVLPVLDNGATQVGIASLVAGAAWTVVAHAVPRRQVVVPAVPAALSLVPASLISIALVGQALHAAHTPTAALRLDPSDPVASPWLLVPTVLALVALLVALVPAAARQADVARGLVAVGLLAGVATLALHPVPLWTVVVALTAIAATYAADVLRRDDAAAVVPLVGAWLLLVLTLPAASASTTLLLLPLGVLAATAAASAYAARFPGAGETGGLVLPLALSALVWVLGDLAHLDATRAVPVLVVLAAVVVSRPRVETEVTAVLAGGVATLAAVPFATDEAVSLSWHLLLAGALVVVHALVHESRRDWAWAGAGLVLLGTWVRLWAADATATEVYSGPVALALLLLGVFRMRRDPATSTGVALTPGLLLATLPSLVTVMVTEPVSLRAALLGLACLVLAIGGAQLRWSSPLLVGVAVGTLLLLVESAPYAAATPQWVLIALAGTALVAVGTTWEARVVDARRAASYVGRLR